MAGMGETIDDDAKPLETRQVLVGNMTYSVSVFPSDGLFVASWRCPVCEQRQGCSHRTDTRAEAVECMEAEVHKHHAQFHRDENSKPSSQINQPARAAAALDEIPSPPPAACPKCRSKNTEAVNVVRTYSRGSLSISGEFRCHACGHEFTVAMVK
jgi:hypothetical protein